MASEPIERHASCTEMARAYSAALGAAGPATRTAGAPEMHPSATLSPLPAGLAGAVTRSREDATEIDRAASRGPEREVPGSSRRRAPRALAVVSVLIAAAAAAVLRAAALPQLRAGRQPGAEEAERAPPAAAESSSGPVHGSVPADATEADPGGSAPVSRPASRPERALTGAPSPAGTAPGSGSPSGDDPADAGAGVRDPAMEQRLRSWQPLVGSEGLPGWQTEGQSGWSVEGGVLRLTGTAILVQEARHGDAAYALRVRTREADAAFGLVLRAQSGGRAVKLEFQGAEGTLRYGTRTEAVSFRWPPGEEHEIALIAKGPSVTAFIDRNRVATLEEPALVEPGRFGVYSRGGTVEFLGIHMQPLQ
jgi:hypothetical protein